MTERMFIIVLDSFGIGELPDAARFGDEGSDTLRAAFGSAEYSTPTMQKLGLFNIDGVSVGERVDEPIGQFGRLAEKSNGKDTTVGHWEMAGCVSENPFPVYPNGFPPRIIEEFEKRTGRKTLCNKPYSGTEVIKDFGEQHMETGDLIVYTSGDSVFQIAAHEDVVPIEKLYEYCETAREILQGDDAVARVIARPFEGEYPFKRTANRHDFSLAPPEPTVLDELEGKGFDVIGIGKIYDIFAGRGITEKLTTKNNADGLKRTLEVSKTHFNGLCFVNLVDFDAVYGHRNDVDGYARALTEFDLWLTDFLPTLGESDALIVVADHGCDPSTPSTDHSREYVPYLEYRKGGSGKNLGTVKGLDYVARRLREEFGL